MPVSDLERAIRRGLLGLLKVVRRNNITTQGFLKLYKERFTVRNGVVTVKNVAPPAPDVPSPVETAAPPVDPLPGTPEFEQLSISEKIRITDARNAARQAARRTARVARVRAMPTVYLRR